MSFKTFNFILLALVVLLSGCGLKEGVVTKEQQSFLSFTGNTKGAIAYIDTLPPIALKKSAKTILYQITPGKHSIIVKRSGVEIVNRNILIGNGITREIQIP